MIEYADKKRTDKQIRKMFISLIRRNNPTRADELKRKILIQRIKEVLAK